jgi:hypothetical protein
MAAYMVAAMAMGIMSRTGARRANMTSPRAKRSASSRVMQAICASPLRPM